jgi:hypothetical protein
MLIYNIKINSLWWYLNQRAITIIYNEYQQLKIMHDSIRNYLTHQMQLMGFATLLRDAVTCS